MRDYSHVGPLFGVGATDYDRHRRQLIPCFDEFYGAARRLVQHAFSANGRASPVIIDLGAGSGLLSDLLLSGCGEARAVLIDLSEDMLARARDRFGEDPRVSYRIADYTEATLVEPGTADAVVSALSIHHLAEEDKRLVYRHAFDWLRPGGIFVNADQVLGATPALERQYRADWRLQVEESELSRHQLEQALKRMEADRMAPLEDQMGLLRDAGFTECDCAYKNFSFAVFWASKS